VPASGAEIEEALTAAERLLVQAREDARHAQNVQFAAISLLVLSLVSIGGVVIAIIESASPLAILAFASLCALGIPAAVYLMQIARSVSRDRDTLALQIAVEIATMIGDVFLDVAADESWSMVRVESVRLRLSVFPLERRVIPVAKYRTRTASKAE